MRDEHKSAEFQADRDRLEILRVAYEQGLRGLNSQDATLSSIRQSGAAIAALNGLAAAFLGRQALEDQRAAFGLRILSLGIFEWIAMLALVTSVICVVQLFRPRDGWIFHFEPSKVLDQFAFGPRAASLATTYNALARFAEENYNSNDPILRRLFQWLVAAIITFCIHVCSWLAALA